MEIDNILQHASNLDEYVCITQRVLAMPADSKINFNMSTVLSLKKVRALEIEYFNKCAGRGAALLLFERIVDLPASKTWGVLGKELVLLLQYWLDAMRKHLVKFNNNWWNFMKILLKFIRFIRVKDSSLPNIILEYTAEPLLELAAGSAPDVQQRLKILYCLNLCCQDSGREIRIALREKLDNYLLKLSKLIATCGHWPTQFAILENLMRWLVPRHDPVLRQTASSNWFPNRVFGEKATMIFLERRWLRFYQDARDFLNAYNDTSELVVSVVCRKVSFGNLLLSDKEKREYWLDVNSDKSLSMVVFPEILETMGHSVETMESLILNDESIYQLNISKTSLGVVLTVHLSQPPPILLCGAKLGVPTMLQAVISSKYTDRLDRTLRNNYNQRYKILLDLFNVTRSLSPQEKKATGCMDEDTQLSLPAKFGKRKKHSGSIVRSRDPIAGKSPSAASTDSLLQLHEKLAQLPQYDFKKQAVPVSALPELSTVTEVSDTNDKQSGDSVATVKKNTGNEKKSQSDGEIHKWPKVGSYLSPADKIDESSSNCLLEAVIGSDESIINETRERFSKTKDFTGDNIVDLIVQEAFQKDYQDKDKLLDSGMNTGDNRKTPDQIFNNESIEKTSAKDLKVQSKRQGCQKGCTVISNTTTDESNDVVYDTPLNFVNARKRHKKLRQKVVPVNNPDNKKDQRQVFDEQVVENFFTQHLNENQHGEVAISPTLARKINESSSEISDHFDDCWLHQDDNVNKVQIEIQNIDNKRHPNRQENQVDGNNRPDILTKIDIVNACQPEIQVHDNISHTNQQDIQVDDKIVHKNIIEIVDVDIVACLNNIVDIVSSHLEKCNENLNNDFNLLERGIVMIDNQNDIPIKDTTNINKMPVNKEKGLRKAVINPKSVKLKYPAKKPVRTRTNSKKINNKLELKSSVKMSPIIEAKTSTDVCEKERTSESNDSPTNKSNCLDLPLIRRKRKLYSPKDGNGVQRHNKMLSDEEEDNDFKAMNFQTSNYKATSYKDIEEDRKKRLSNQCSRKSRSKFEQKPSPRTKKNNDIFDRLKDKIESNDSVFADKTKGKDLAIYNFTSDSEDEDFKKKKAELQKRMSPTTMVTSGDSSMSTRHGRLVNKVNYSENKSPEETKNPIVTKPKTARRKRKTKAKQVKQEKNLLDERMRKVASEEFNTSTILKKPAQIPITATDLILPKRPEMEIIPDEEVEMKTEQFIDKTKKSMKTNNLSLKKDKSIINKKSNYNLPQPDTDEDGKESPLPALLVETIPDKQDDINDSISVNMLQKLQKIQQEGPDTSINATNTTQNLLSDIEKINYSPPLMNVTDEFNKIEKQLVVDNVKETSKKNELKRSKPSNTDFKKLRKQKKTCSTITTQNANEFVKIIEITGDKSENSIETLGKSPITAHGDNNEKPPDTTLLIQDYQHRDMGVEDLDQSIQDYFNKLRDKVANLPKSRCKSHDSGSTKVISKKLSSQRRKSPVVSISRLSVDDISKWLPSSRNSDTDSSYSAKATEIRYTTKAEIEHYDDNSYEVSKRNKPIIENLGKTILKESIDFDERSKTSAHDQRYSGSKSNSIKGSMRLKIQKRSDKIMEKALNTTNSHKKFKSGTKMPLVSEHQNSPITNKKETLTQIRKSTISPIKLFDVFPTVSYELSDDDNSISQRIDINYSKNKAIKTDKKLSVKENIDISSTDSKMSTSTKIKISEETSKRKSDRPLEEYGKKRRLDKTEVLPSGSENSVSSVNEWFRRIAPVTRDESINASLCETVKYVMEKLDTTLSEIHQNTSEKFIHMFVNAQKQLLSGVQERREMFRSVASEILAHVVELIDVKFAELDQRSQEMDAVFMEKLKSEGLKLIQEDCKKKEVMVSILREDVEAVLDHIAKTQKDNC